MMVKKVTGVGGNLSLPTTYVWGASNTLYGLDATLCIFQFWKGSVCYKYGATTNEQTAMIAKNINQNNTPFTDLSQNNCDPTAEIRVPYQTPVSMISTRLNNTFVDENHAGVLLSRKGAGGIWAGAGEDFRVSHLQWPPWGVTQGIISSTSYGQTGLFSLFT